MFKKPSSRFVFFCLIYVILLSSITEVESADISKGEKALQEQAALYARSGDFEKAFKLINEALEKTNNKNATPAMR